MVSMQPQVVSQAPGRGVAAARYVGEGWNGVVVVAGTILITYVALGFLGGYLTTTLWYGKRLQRK
jgi:hypothetical protein